MRRRGQAENHGKGTSGDGAPSSKGLEQKNDVRIGRTSLIVQLVKNPPVMQETLVRSLGWEALLEKG